VPRDDAERSPGADRVRPDAAGPARTDGERRGGAAQDAGDDASSPARPSPRDGKVEPPREPQSPAPLPTSPPAGIDPDDPDGELALTLAGLLAEYQGAAAPRTGSERGPAAEVAVPAARPHASGSMALPVTDQRFAPRPGDAPDPASSSTGAGPAGRARRGENGARLADLLAEAMDAFRHTGPGEGTPGIGDGNGDGARGPGVGSGRR
jgi:hypothetical protein